jgi:hypothetical protein
MTHLREHWEGASLTGNYTLEQWLGSDDHAAFFQTSSAPDGRPAVVKLVPEALVEAAPPLDLWHRIRQLRHPNLVELLDFGRADHDGQIVFYAVFEAPDETLSSALSRSALSSQEAREVLDSALDALRYLHAQGLVLGALDPDHIVAIGDRIKLSTGALRYADTTSAYREDVRLLGDLWQRHLMAASPKSSQLAAHAADPNPNARWTLAEINAALGPPPPAAPPPPPPRVASLVAEPPVSEAPVSTPLVSELPMSATPAPARNQVPAPPPYPRPASERAAPYRFPKWVFVGAAGILLLGLGLLRPRPAGVATRPPVAPVVLPAETPTPVPPSKAAVPDSLAPDSGAPPAIAAPAVPKPSAVAGREMWRVIAFTYRTREAAARKVQQLNQNHPGLNAGVFSPEGKRGYYLVSLGGRMTHEEAVRVQRSARGKGLPRDLYVQNYTQ